MRPAPEHVTQARVRFDQEAFETLAGWQLDAIRRGLRPRPSYDELIAAMIGHCRDSADDIVSRIAQRRGGT